MEKMSRPIVSLTRVECFSASHRLHNQSLTDEENRLSFGKCNNYHGHGHNYKIEVTVEGPVDPVTGMVINLEDLKVATKSVLDQIDHKNLDKDVPYFSDIVSTTENLTVYIWEEIKKYLPDPLILKTISVHETDKNLFRYSGKTA